MTAIPETSVRGVGGRLRSIRFRVVAAFLAALLALSAAQVFQIWQQERVSRSLTLMTRGYLPLSRIVALLDPERQKIDSDVARMLRGEPRPAVKEGAPRVYTVALREKLEFGRAIADDALAIPAISPGEALVWEQVRVKLDLIDSLFQGYEETLAATSAAEAAGRPEEALALRETLVRDGPRVGEEIDKLGRVLGTRIERLTTTTKDAQVRASAVSLGLTALALAFSVILVVAVLFALRPVAHLTTEVQRLAAGDYGGRVAVRGRDEVAILAAEFNAMARAIEQRDGALVQRAEELNRLSAYLGSVLDSLQDALVVVEAGRVTLSNPAAARTWGVRKGDPPPPVLEDLLLRPGRHEHTGDQGRQLEIRITPFGRDGAVVIAADVTEANRAKEQLARSERLALVGQMLAQITHEVRNPLNALSLNTELLSDELGALDPDRRTEAWEIHATIAAEIQRLTAVTAHYLQLARRPPTRLEDCDIAEILDDVVRVLATELDRAGVEIAFERTPIERQLVDGNQLRQALHNVLRNAVESGARHLVLSTKETDGEVQIALEDDGPGMSPEDAQRSCDPFFSTKPKGTGLGLAITKQILEDHDGAVRVESNPGEGTTLTLVLPRRPAAAHQPETPHAPDDPGR